MSARKLSSKRLLPQNIQMLIVFLHKHYLGAILLYTSVSDKTIRGKVSHFKTNVLCNSVKTYLSEDRARNSKEK